MEGFRSEFVAPRRERIHHLRGSHQKNADRGKEPAKPTQGNSYVNVQRKTR